MSSTLNKSLKSIVSSIVENYTNFHPTDDFPIPKNLVAEKVNDMRRQLIRDEARALRRVNPSYYIKSCCIEVKCVTEACTIEGITVTEDEPLYYIDLPQIIELDDFIKSIIYVGPAGMESKNDFKPISLNGFQSINGNRYTSTKRKYYRIGTRLYLKNAPKDIGLLCVIFLPYNPATVCNYNDESDYPAPDYQKIELMVLRHFFSSSPFYADKTQNSEDPTIQSQKQTPQIDEQQ